MEVNYDEHDGEEIKRNELPKQSGKIMDPDTSLKEQTGNSSMVTEPFSNYSIISKSEKRVRIM